MEIKKKFKLNKDSQTILINEIEEYLNSRGFGSMNKNDFEVLIIHALSSDKWGLMSNYDFSRELKIPETKTKRLRYEADLRYGSDNERDKFIKLQSALDKAVLKENNKKIQFVIEDQSLIDYLDNKLKEAGRALDFSYNRELITVDLSDLQNLYDIIPYSKEGLESVLDMAKKLIKKDMTYSELLKLAINNAEEGNLDKNKLIGLGISGLTITVKNIARKIKNNKQKNTISEK